MNCRVGNFPENSLQILHQKIKSPPPKPPRRRHSEQLPPSSDASSCTDIKCIDGCQSCNINSKDKTDGKISSASLPACWTVKLQYGANDKSSPLKYSCTSLQHRNKSLVENACLKRNCEVYFDLIEGKSEENVFFKNTNEPSCCEESLKEETVLMPVSKDVAESYRIKSMNLDAVLQGKRNDVENMQSFKLFHPEYHRSHHSDPSLCCFGQRNSKKSFNPSVLKNNYLIRNQNIEDTDRKIDNLNACLACEEMQCLHEEIKILKDMNDKLMKSFLSMQTTLENIQNISSQDSDNVCFTEVLSDVYYAQKARENAMEKRLKIALEDRNAAFIEVENMMQAVVGVFEDSIENSGLNDSFQSIEKNSKNIQEVLQDIDTAENPYKLLHHQKLIMSYINYSKEMKQDLSQELKLMLSERDTLVEKVKKLEMEVEDLKHCNNLRDLDFKNWEENLLDMFCYVVHQRDLILSKFDRSQNTDLSSQKLCKVQNVSKTCSNLEAAKESTIKESSPPSHAKSIHDQQFNLISRDAKFLKKEVIMLSHALEVEVQKNKGIEAKCQRLEKLVNILRKKISGKTTGIIV